MKKQVFIIHGGDTFKTYEEYLLFLKDWEIDFEKYKENKKNWKINLQEELGDEFEVIAPKMPNKINAKYLEWKIWFEKFIPYITEGVILVGHSLGGSFLVKFLSENDMPKKIRGTFLVAPVYDEDSNGYSLADFKLPDNLSGFEKQGGQIFIYHSEDDPVVPFNNLGKFKEKLISAKTIIFKNKQHFGQEKLPEIVKDIKGL